MNKITGPIPTEIGLLTALTELRVPPASPSPARGATDPRRRRYLQDNQITGPIPPQIGKLTKLEILRVPPASQDARRGARPPLGVAGTSAAIRSTARSRPRSASSPS